VIFFERSAWTTETSDCNGNDEGEGADVGSDDMNWILDAFRTQKLWKKVIEDCSTRLVRLFAEVQV